ncbi:unnamed protein product, partial [Mesorhabditis belari]|uniref:SCP domain-containing protein n=1 Tax=Mesorhabditis belari TaxID=2138241 RepID=A0AAF3FD91_9BILA
MISPFCAMVPVCFLLAILPLSLAASNQLGCSLNFGDDFRYTAVNNLNIYRQIVANGTAPNKCGSLPAAKNMYKLFYNCDLESKAYAYTSSCGSSSVPSNSMNYMTMSSAPWTGTAASNILTIFQTHLNAIVTNGAPANVAFSGNSALSGWNSYVTGTKTAVGCAVNPSCTYSNPSFPYMMVVACVFDTPAASTGNPSYEVGTKCAADSDCTTYMGSTCDTTTGLCQYQFVDSGANTLCPGSTAGWTDAQRNLMLQWHNQLRSSLAQGKEKDGGSYASTYAPGSKTMTQMAYNCSVEINAVNNANGCDFAHTTSAQRPGMGENLYMSSDVNQPEATAAAAAPQAWWSELPDYGFGPDLNLTSAQFNRIAPAQIGHYTQMAWQETTTVGCAIKHCPTGTMNGVVTPMTYVVCQYYPAGNYLNQNIYVKSTQLGCATNADCGAGRTCNTVNKLCVV